MPPLPGVVVSVLLIMSVSVLGEPVCAALITLCPEIEHCHELQSAPEPPSAQGLAWGLGACRPAVRYVRVTCLEALKHWIFWRSEEVLSVKC